MDDLYIQAAGGDDIATIAEIYNYYVLNTNCTLDYTKVSHQQMYNHWKKIISKDHPFLVLCRGNAILGYAYATHLRKNRLGWRKTLAVSIYLSPEHTGKGGGTLLLDALIKKAEQLKAVSLVSYVTVRAQSRSMKLHEKLGFVKIGVLKNAGYKQKQYCDIAIYQYLLHNITTMNKE